MVFSVFAKNPFTSCLVLFTNNNTVENSLLSHCAPHTKLNTPKIHTALQRCIQHLPGLPMLYLLFPFEIEAKKSLLGGSKICIFSQRGLLISLPLPFPPLPLSPFSLPSFSLSPLLLISWEASFPAHGLTSSVST